MKLVAAFAVAALSLPFGTQAFAQSNQAPVTRAEVRQQLIDAEADGLLPSNRNDYPPSSAEIAHNRALHAARLHDGWPRATTTAEN
ncbi:hypothetical protein WT83_18855 [Burkholderia territorii]|uniref:DUF4148 domain-containing protein n=1 Tax=Burkholderia territorii TaxID=1503055 RepID=A0A108ELU0_9BURK|nr:DUF4148 domain-containing protein [Burkholderia territorii]KWN13468.1 hypothetical protein WT83_18855 [Burkholderia territorii]